MLRFFFELEVSILTTAQAMNTITACSRTGRKPKKA
jgi:hypothetical protein